MSTRSLSAIADDMEQVLASKASGRYDDLGEDIAVLLAEALGQWIDDVYPFIHTGKGEALRRLLASYEALARSMGWRT